MTFELDSNNHAVFSLNYHLILVIKYRKKIWEESFWTTSYCLISVDNIPINVLKMYIENQGRVQH